MTSSHNGKLPIKSLNETSDTQKLTIHLQIKNIVNEISKIISVICMYKKLKIKNWFEYFLLYLDSLFLIEVSIIILYPIS